VTYFITFSTYGSHVHGADEGSVDRSHNHYRAPLVKPNPRRLGAELRLMDQPPCEMDERRRQAVLEAIMNRGERENWAILAVHVRTNHVHLIIQSEDAPEFVMTQLKSAASRHLNELGFEDRNRKRWARHGSTRMLFNEEAVEQAIAYIIDGQGDTMSAFRG